MSRWLRFQPTSGGPKNRFTLKLMDTIPFKAGSRRVFYGLAIRRIRYKRKLSQLDLAERVRTSRVYVSKMELGLYPNPNIGALVRFADGLDVRIWTLIRYAHWLTRIVKKHPELYSQILSDMRFAVPLGPGRSPNKEQRKEKTKLYEEDHSDNGGTRLIDTTCADSSAVLVTQDLGR